MLPRVESVDGKFGYATMGTGTCAGMENSRVKIIPSQSSKGVASEVTVDVKVAPASFIPSTSADPYIFTLRFHNLALFPSTNS
jgi:hypothetical protein